AGRRLGDIVERLAQSTDERTRRKLLFVAHGREEFAGRDEAIDLVVDALMKSAVLRFEYKEGGGPVRAFRVQPLSMVVSDRQLYLVAREGSGAPPSPYRLRD